MPQKVKCQACHKFLDYDSVPETSMGAVKCPHCKATIDQTGKVLQKGAARRVVEKFISGDNSEGEMVKKFLPAPEQKPPRRRPGVKNKSNRSDYMKNYMNKYRKEDGKDYQKVPDEVKKFRAEQRKRLREKFKLKASTITSSDNIGIGITSPSLRVDI